MAASVTTRQVKSANDRMKAEIKRLRSYNELYEKYSPKWEFFLNAYEGGSDFANNPANLFRHVREHQKDFDDRVSRSHYLNYCEPLVEFFTDFIYQETIQRDGAANAAFFNDFKSDVNKKGEDIDTFMKEVCNDAQIFGHMFVIVDAPTSPARLTKAQQAAAGIRPYWVSVRPDEVLDWVADAFDKVLYLKRRQIMTLLDTTSMTKRLVERYTEWTLDQIKITDVDITDGDDKAVLLPATEVANKLGEVPIHIFRYKRSKRDRWMGKSFLNSLAGNNREVMNLTSLLQEFLYRQCFNMLAMQIDQNQDQEEQQQGEFSSSNILLYPKDAAHVPAYVSPPIAPAKFLQEERQRIVTEMFKYAHQDLVNELNNGQKASGYSKQQSFVTSATKIASRADILQRGEMRLMQLTMKYMKTKWDGTIKYKDNYNVTNVADSLAQLKQLFTDMQLRSETMLKIQLKRMVHEIDGKLTPDQIKSVEAEIDKMDTDKWFETMELSLIGRAAMSPEAATSAVAGPAPKEAAAQSASGRARKPSTSTASEVASEASKKPKPGGRTAASR
jgi:hypothetical protein